MKGKKLLAILLAVVMIVPLFAGAFTANAEPAKSGKDYPTVFVHGLLGWGDEDAINKIVPYWGMTSGNMNAYLHNQGYETYVASVGPVSSAWDRCCELYGQLTGTKIDYGQAHADKCNAQYEGLGFELQHGRYGRDYTNKALIDEPWGPIIKDGKVIGWNDTKVNLVGHSFGGPTIVYFLQLLAEGDEAERAWGRQQAAIYGGDWHDYISPLFWGDYDGEYLVNSITTLAGVLNGTTFISANPNETEMLTALVVTLGNALGCTDIVGLYDFQLEHFGLTKTPGTDAKAYFSYLKREGFMEGDDQAWHDLSIAGCNELKRGWEAYDNVYYFSYSGDKTFEGLLTGNNVPDPDMFLMFMPFSAKIGSYTNRYEFVYNVDGTRYGYIDNSWKPNDGMVNSIAARYPLGAAHKAYDKNNIEAGVWNVYPDQDIDHLGFSGGIINSKPIQCRKLYSNMMADIAATKPIENTNSSSHFTDVNSGDYFYDAVLWAVENGITNGTSPTTFSPNKDCTRAQSVTFLWRAMGCPTAKTAGSQFNDVKKGDYYYDAVRWAVENGITKGTSATTFSPNDKVTRAQAVTFLYRAAKADAPSAQNPFKDVSDGAYYYDAVLWAVENGITNGTSAAAFSPDKTCTRGQIVTFLYRYFG